MTFKELLNIVLVKAEEMGHKRHLKPLSYTADEKELHSYLRENIFREDTKTSDFINAIKASEEKVVYRKDSMDEKEFTEFIFDSVKSALNKKDSKFKIAWNWFSPEGDLCINLADRYGNTAHYRVMAVRTHETP